MLQKAAKNKLRQTPMHILIPLLIILIVFNHKQLKADHYYRAFIFCIVGIYYFCVVQYSFYWLKIFPGDYYSVIFFLLVCTVATVGLGFSKWAKRTSPYKTGIVAATFLTCLILDFTYEVSIKNWLAEQGGYFTHVQNTERRATTAQTVNINDLGVSLNLNEQWQRRELDTGHGFYGLIENGEKRAELRPNCIQNLAVDIPTDVQNTLILFESTPDTATTNCSGIENHKQCLIKVQYTDDRPEKQKWRWMKINPQTGQGMEIDLLIYSDTVDQTEEFTALLKSARLIKKHGHLDCATPAAWL